MDLNPLNSDHTFSNLFLITHSASLSCTSGLKDFEI